MPHEAEVHHGQCYMRQPTHAHLEAAHAALGSIDRKIAHPKHTCRPNSTHPTHIPTSLPTPALPRPRSFYRPLRYVLTTSSVLHRWQGKTNVMQCFWTLWTLWTKMKMTKVHIDQNERP